MKRAVYLEETDWDLVDELLAVAGHKIERRENELAYPTATVVLGWNRRHLDRIRATIKPKEKADG